MLKLVINFRAIWVPGHSNIFVTVYNNTQDVVHSCWFWVESTFLKTIWWNKAVLLNFDAHFNNYNNNTRRSFACLIYLSRHFAWDYFITELSGYCWICTRLLCILIAFRMLQPVFSTLPLPFTFTFGAGAVKLPSAEAVLSSAQCTSPIWPKVKVSS